MIGFQPIMDQYFLIRSVHEIHLIRRLQPLKLNAVSMILDPAADAHSLTLTTVTEPGPATRAISTVLDCPSWLMNEPPPPPPF